VFPNEHRIGIDPENRLWPDNITGGCERHRDFSGKQM
jgi:hypothetical protein